MPNEHRKCDSCKRPAKFAVEGVLSGKDTTFYACAWHVEAFQ